MKWQEWHRFKKGVYFVQCNATGYVKIGYSAYIGGRLRDLNQQAVRGATLIFAFPGDRMDEVNLHYECRQWRVHGEWFTPEPGLFKVISKKRRMHGPDSMRIKTPEGFAGLRKEEDADAVAAAWTLIECGLEMLGRSGVEPAAIQAEIADLFFDYIQPAETELVTAALGGN